LKTRENIVFIIKVFVNPKRGVRFVLERALFTSRARGHDRRSGRFEMSSPPPGKRAKGGMIRIPSYIAAALGLRSCEVREDEIQGRMLLAGIATESDVFNSPILFGLMYHARDVFLDRVVPKLDRLDLVMLSRTNTKVGEFFARERFELEAPEQKFGMRAIVKSRSLLQWARENGCPWDARVCAAAARGGHLETLQWARANGCPWDLMTGVEAASGGFLETLKWARENGCSWDVDTCTAAAKHGHLRVLKYLRLNKCPWNSWTCAVAAKHGRLETLKWARANGCPWDVWTGVNAAEAGHLETLRWARGNGCPINESTCAHAARGGSLDIVRWLRGSGCPWDENTTANAAERGHLELLKWARENDCPWTARTSSRAAEGGHLETLKWAIAHGCPFDDETCRRAAQGGHLETLKWLRANGCPWDGRTCAYAALRGYRRVAEWARANGCPWSEDACPLNAVYRVLCDGTRGAFSLFPEARAEAFRDSESTPNPNRRNDESTRGAHVSDIERALRGRFSVAQVRAALATLEVENYVRSPVKEYYRPIEFDRV